MNKEQLQELLSSYGLRPNFTYGQNFLIDEIVLEDIVDAAGVKAGDKILEIGPGIGNLTRKLLERGASVLAVEKDPKFLPILHRLKKDFKKTLRFEIADALEYNFQDYFKALPGKAEYKVVANIPYYVTGKILQMLLSANFKPESITVLAQKEVAQNVVAGPGKLSILGISVQLFGRPALVRTVPARAFYPAPKVDSAVLRIELFKKLPFELENEKKFFGILHACFAGKRKQLHNTLKNNLQISKERVEEILKQAEIPSAARPQELSIQQWLALTKLIEEIK